MIGNDEDDDSINLNIIYVSWTQPANGTYVIYVS